MRASDEWAWIQIRDLEKALEEMTNKAMILDGDNAILEAKLAVAKGTLTGWRNGEKYDCDTDQGTTNFYSDMKSILDNTEKPLAVAEGRIFVFHEEPLDNVFKSYEWFDQFCGNDKEELINDSVPATQVVLERKQK